MTETQAKEKLMTYDIDTYEQLFGELEEAQSESKNIMELSND